MSWNQPSVATVDLRDARVATFLSRVYGWMFLGLLITAGTAFVVASSQTFIETGILNRAIFWILIIAQFGLVFFLSARVDKLAPATAAGCASSATSRTSGRRCAGMGGLTEPRRRVARSALRERSRDDTPRLESRSGTGCG